MWSEVVVGKTTRFFFTCVVYVIEVVMDMEGVCGGEEGLESRE